MTELHFQSADQRPSRLPYWTPESPTAATARTSLWQKAKNILTKPLFVGVMAIFVIAVFSGSLHPWAFSVRENAARTLTASKEEEFQQLINNIKKHGREGTAFGFKLTAKNTVFAKMDEGRGRWTSYVKIDCPKQKWSTDPSQLMVCKAHSMKTDRGLCDLSDKQNGKPIPTAKDYECEVCVAQEQAKLRDEEKFPLIYHTGCHATLSKDGGFKETLYQNQDILVMLDGSFEGDLRPNTNPKKLTWTKSPELTAEFLPGVGAQFVLSETKMYELAQNKQKAFDSNMQIAMNNNLGVDEKARVIKNSKVALRASLTFAEKQGQYYAADIDVNA